MAQGNPVALKHTFESFSDHVSEFVFGDLLILPEDRQIIEEYRKDFNLKIVPLPFNHIFKNGFGATLNTIAEHASNTACLYMNCGEVINLDFPAQSLSGIFVGETHNCGFFDHASDKHRWIRLYNKETLRWDGLIHEEIKGPRKVFPYPVFCMADTPKDMGSVFYANICNDIKEICYWQQYVRLVDEPRSRGLTNEGWIRWAQEGYQSFRERLNAKGNRYKAFVEGDIDMYIRSALRDIDHKKHNEFKMRRFANVRL
jgi:hypothetical protein